MKHRCIHFICLHILLEPNQFVQVASIVVKWYFFAQFIYIGFDFKLLMNFLMFFFNTSTKAIKNLNNYNNKFACFDKNPLIQHLQFDFDINQSYIIFWKIFVIFVHILAGFSSIITVKRSLKLLFLVENKDFWYN